MDYEQVRVEMRLRRLAKQKSGFIPSVVVPGWWSVVVPMMLDRWRLWYEP